MEKNNGLALLLLNYPVFNLIAPKRCIALKKGFPISAAHHAYFTFILLEKTFFAFFATKLKSRDIRRQTTEQTFWAP